MPRRPNNEGSVYFDSANGCWIACVPFKDEKGRLKYRKKRAPRQKDAEAHRRDMVKLRDTHGPGAEKTLAEFVEYLKAEVWPKQKLSPKTEVNYEIRLRKYILPAFGKKTLVELSGMASEIERWANRIDKRVQAIECLRLLSAILKRAVRPYRLIPFNPCEGIEPPDHQAREGQSLKPDEAARLITAAKGTRLEGIVLVALRLGLRKAEIIGARWDSVDLENRLWKVTEQWMDVKDFKGFTPPKSAQGIRTIPIPSMLHQWLSDHKSRAGSTLVFPSGSGTPISPRNLSRDFTKLLSDAGLPPIRFHDLRHTALSIMEDIGATPKARQTVAGHAKVQMVDERYTHAFIETLRRFMDESERRMG